MNQADIYLTSDTMANDYLKEDPFALLLGMLLDQQIPMERAFSAPFTLDRRMKAHGFGALSPSSLFELTLDQVTQLFSEKPALHRFPKAMAQKAHQLATVVMELYSGKAEQIWTEAESGERLLQRLKAMNGFGTEKAKIFIALLGKRFNSAPEGWQEASEPFSLTGRARSVADASSPEALREIREFKRAVKTSNGLSG